MGSKANDNDNLCLCPAPAPCSPQPPAAGAEHFCPSPKFNMHSWEATGRMFQVLGLQELGVPFRKAASCQKLLLCHKLHSATNPKTQHHCAHYFRAYPPAIWTNSSQTKATPISFSTRTHVQLHWALRRAGGWRRPGDLTAALSSVRTQGNAWNCFKGV